ncbi:TPA: hypothetical protein QEL11_002799 [Stenotrophomonas maltophilia]|nr:hypothetical protein [Stenotrophomonas maltophilia]
MSPLDGLQMPAQLACEFFAVFSRFEFALKDSGYYYVNRRGRAAADWDRYFLHANDTVRTDADPDLFEAVQYLTDEPPQVQVAPAQWNPNVPLRGGPGIIGTALDATGRVRNNLFHGGKHTPHSPPGRDEKLVRSALCLLRACLKQDQQLAAAYEQPTAF